MSKIKVIDSVMGSGKTSYAIQMMNTEPGPYLYVAPYLDEADRIKESCVDLDFVTPERRDGRSKSNDLLSLVAAGRNIASTHALFKLITAEVLELIEAAGYTLVVDEIIEVIEPLDINKKERDGLFAKDILSRGAAIHDTGDRAFKILPGSYQDFDGLDIRINGARTTLQRLRSWADTGRLVQLGDATLFWLLPANCFDVFERVYCLTYLFAGSYTKAFYDLHGAKYSYHSVQRTEDGTYQLCPHDEADESEAKAKIEKLINIYSGRMNAIGRNHKALSWNWWRKHPRDYERAVRKHLVSFFRNHVDNPGSEYNMWCCFKPNREGLSGKGYTRGWTPFNMRATNSLRHKTNLAYVVNRFVKPDIVNYFKTLNVHVEDGLFSVSELLQWIWRSGIRDGKPIYLYLPSFRMKSLLAEWMHSPNSDLTQ